MCVCVCARVACVCVSGGAAKLDWSAVVDSFLAEEEGEVDEGEVDEGEDAILL